MRKSNYNCFTLICFLSTKVLDVRTGRNNQDSEVFKNAKFHFEFDTYNNASYAEYTELKRKNNISTPFEEKTSSYGSSNEENGISEKDRNYTPWSLDHMTLSPEEMVQDFLELKNDTLVSQDFEIVGVKVYPYHLKEFLEEKANMIPVRGFARLIDARNVRGVMQSRYELISLFKHMVSQYVFEYCSPIERLVWGSTRPIERLGYRRFEAIWKEVDLSAINATSSTQFNIDDFTEAAEEWFF